MSQQNTDIAIIGAGILGLSHAYAAARRGLRVRVFERSATPLGASIRNFGQALVGGQPPGVMLDLARASRLLWAEWAEHAGFAALSGVGAMLALAPLPALIRYRTTVRGRIATAA